MKTRFFFSAVLMALSLVASANDDIPLSQEGVPLPGSGNNPRSVYEISATISNQVVTVSFDSQIESRVIIIDSQTSTTVYDQTFVPSYSVQANLSSLPAGSYTLYVYAYGIWWHGAFAIG